MSVNAPKASRVFAVTTLTLSLTGCATGHLPIYYADASPKSHQVAEVRYLASREEIVAVPKLYQALQSAGIADQDIQNGSVGIGRVYCCGGKGTVETENQVFFYDPPGHQVEYGDVIEFIVGKDPDGNRPGQLNTFVKVRHKKGMESGACRWLPDDVPGLWMRVIYCGWMASEGWQKGGMLGPVWYKPAD